MNDEKAADRAEETTNSLVDALDPAATGRAEPQRDADAAAASAGPGGIATAVYAHAPTGRPAVDLDADLDIHPEEHVATVGLDRRMDGLWWLWTPIAVLLLGPLFAGVATFFVVGADTGYPAVCRPVAGNGCEEAVLRMLVQHIVAFVAGWALLWAVPWWRGLRPYRIALAVAVLAVLFLVPVRLMS